MDCQQILVLHLGYSKGCAMAFTQKYSIGHLMGKDASDDIATTS